MAKDKSTNNGNSAVAEPATETALVANEHNPVAEVPDVSMFMEDAGDNNFDKDDLAIPFLKVLQKNSPQVEKRDPAYVEGAEAGCFFNSATGELWNGEEGLIAIPIAYTPSYTEWKPERKGFVRDWGADSRVMEQTHKGGKDGMDDITSSGNVIQRAGLYYLLIWNQKTGDVSRVVFSMSGSQLAVSRKWNTNIAELRITDLKTNKRFNPAMYYMSYNMTSAYKENEKGSWFIPDIKPYRPTTELAPNGTEIYLAARAFKQMVIIGSVKVKHEQAEGKSADDVPF